MFRKFYDAGATDGGGATETILKGIADLGVKQKEQTDAVKSSFEAKYQELDAAVTEAKSAAQKAEAKAEGLEKSIGTMTLSLQTPDSKKSFLQLIEEGLKAKSDEIGLVQEAKQQHARFEVKANTSLMTVPYVSSAPNAYLPMPDVANGGQPYSSPFLMNNVLGLLNVQAAGSPNITWVNRSAIEGDAAWTAEGALKAQVAWKYTNETATAKKITDFVKVTTEALKDITFLAGEINTVLRELIIRKVNTDLLLGDGTGNTIAGIRAAATAFTSTSYNAKITTPSNVEAIIAMAGQARQLGFTPNMVLMNSVDLDILQMSKVAATGALAYPNVLSDGRTFIGNMQVIANTDIPAGFALVGDFSKFNVRIVDNLTIDIGLDGDDFTNNRRTIIGEMRLATYVSSVNKPAFVYSALSTVRTAIAAA